MRRHGFNRIAWAAGLALVLLLCTSPARAAIEGVEADAFGNAFSLTAGPGFIVTSDGDSFMMWGYALEGGPISGQVQHPGPTLILQEGVDTTVTLTNSLPAQAGNTSIVFPGLNVTAAGGVPGMLAREAQPGGSVTYTIVDPQPGTYLYRSGTRPDLQVEMGLVGAIVVRPVMGANYAYNDEDTQFDREVLLLITEMDPRIHRLVESGRYSRIDTTDYFPTNWFINGRNFPDNMAENFVPWLPAQPYNFVPRIHPGEIILVRSVGGGRDIHPFHYHGNDVEVLAKNGRLLSSAPGNGPDLAWKTTTRRMIPGQTADVIWTWTGEQLGWDIYGHEPGTDYPRSDINPAWPGNICDPPLTDGVFDPFTWEYCPDHGTPFPVIIPHRDLVAFGQFYSGSPFLGFEGDLPVGHPGLNAFGGYFYMWHSHREKELTSNDIWPGGLVSFMIVEHWAVPID